jgi:hypothetical protein
VFFCRKQGLGGNPDTYSLFTYRQGKGWETTEIQLPASIVPALSSDPNGYTATTPPPYLLSSGNGCRLPVIDITNGIPASNDPTYFNPTTLTPSCAVFEFRKDGTLFPRNTAQDVVPTDPDLYDLNILKDYTPPNTPADIVLKQVGESSKRCFMDIDINTGRVRFRVVETEAQSTATQGG